MIHLLSSVIPLVAATTTAEMTTGMLVVFGIILAALVLFVTEWIPLDITAIGVIVALVALEPFTQVTPQDGVAGFANPATIAVLAMFILSEGVRRTGLVQWVGDKIIQIAAGSSPKQFAMLTGLSGGMAGMINNTPLVAMMIPMVADISTKTKTSPSKYLMPISFISMIGGMLTLIGTSTNLLASDVSDRLLDRPFTMFEFTHLGAVLLVIGFVYLFFVGRKIIPERIKPDDDLTVEFEMDDYLTEVEVRRDSPLLGQTVRQVLAALDLDADIVHMIREGQKFSKPLARKEVCPGDRLMIRTDRENLLRLVDSEALNIVPATGLEARGISDPQRTPRHLAEVVILPDTPLVGETIMSLNFEAQYEAAVLAIRRGRRIFHNEMDEFVLTGGDTLLVLASATDFDKLINDRRFVVIDKDAKPTLQPRKIPVALGIVAAVVGVAALGIFPIMVTALAGVLAMIVTGCLDSNEAYDAVDWPVIFLLAGMIPLGAALEQTGGSAYLAHWIVSAAEFLPPIAMLFVFYIVTTLVTQVISNNASVVLMIPVAIKAAATMGAEPFAFVMAVTFGASTAMLTPIGYQTNLMVYAPGGYKFTDYFRVGAPLQFLLAVATTFGIYWIWGV